MRYFQRPKVLVPTLHQSGLGGKAAIRFVLTFETRGTIPREFEPHWNEPDVRGALIAMQGRVCAYCGTDVGETGFDVEHFRPKGRVHGDLYHLGYWWLAYEFSNYFLSCTNCNRSLKGTAFPLLNHAERVDFQRRHELHLERRLLFDPSVDPLDEWIEVDIVRGTGNLRAREGLDNETAGRVQNVIEFFRLNDRLPIRKKRFALLRDSIAQMEGGKTENLRVAAMRHQPHSVVPRTVLRNEAPHLLPTTRDELAWLLVTLCEDLRAKLQDIEQRPTPHNTRERDELQWALAVIWRTSPIGTLDLIERCLATFNLKKSVEPCYARLLHLDPSTVKMPTEDSTAIRPTDGKTTFLEQDKPVA